MEYKLNKVDIELRRKIKEATKEGVVHTKEKVMINNKNNKNKKEQNKFSDKNKQDFIIERKTNVTIEAFKEDSNNIKEIEAIKMFDENKREVGVILDTKR